MHRILLLGSTGKSVFTSYALLEMMTAENSGINNIVFDYAKAGTFLLSREDQPNAQWTVQGLDPLHMQQCLHQLAPNCSCIVDGRYPAASDNRIPTLFVSSPRRQLYKEFTNIPGVLYEKINSKISNKFIFDLLSQIFHISIFQEYFF
jgi:hypothetical protein